MGSRGMKPIWAVIVIACIIFAQVKAEDDSGPIAIGKVASSATGRSFTGKAAVEDIFPTIYFEATMTKYDPPKFKKWLMKPYVDALINYLAPLQVEVEIIGIHGEDGGTGVITRLTFLTGGKAAVDNFRTNIAPDWNEVKKIWNEKRFGQSPHMEGFSQMCLTKRNGDDPDNKESLKPALILFAALIERSPGWVTPGRQLKYNKALKDYLLPAASIVKSDYFTDDNDESLPNGGRKKPNFNTIIFSSDVGKLASLQADLISIGKKQRKSTTIWPASLGLGEVHIEGSIWVPRICYTGTIKIQEVPSPPPPPPVVTPSPSPPPPVVVPASPPPPPTCLPAFAECSFLATTAPCCNGLTCGLLGTQGILQCLPPTPPPPACSDVGTQCIPTANDCCNGLKCLPVPATTNIQLFECRAPPPPPPPTPPPPVCKSERESCNPEAEPGDCCFPLLCFFIETPQDPRGSF